MQNDVITAETVIKPRRRRPLASTSTNVDIEEGDRLVHGLHADRHRVDEGHVPAGRVKGTSKLCHPCLLFCTAYVFFWRE